MTTVYKFKSTFTKFGVGTAPSVAPLITVVDTSNNVLVNAQATTALSNMPGEYIYSYPGADGLDLTGRFSTTDPTVDQQDLFDYTPELLTTRLIGTIAAGTHNPQSGDAYARLGAPVGASISADIATVDTVADAIKTKTDNLPSDPADQSAVEAAVAAATSPLATAINLATVDTVVDGIKVKTDNLPATPAATGDAMALTAGERTTLTGVIWSALTSGFATVGSIGKLIKDYLDAAISTRAEPGDVTVNIAVSSTVAPVVSSGYLAVEAGYTFEQTVDSNVTDDLATATKVWAVMKKSGVDDSAAMWFVEKTDGLTILKGKDYPAANKTDGSITITGSVGDWHVTPKLEKRATSQLFQINDTFVAAVKALMPSGKTVAVWEDVSNDGDGSSIISDGPIKAIA